MAVTVGRRRATLISATNGPRVHLPKEFGSRHTSCAAWAGVAAEHLTSAAVGRPCGFRR
jgi:hypothetical protein